MTKSSDKRKQQKKTDRKKRLEKARNVERNKPKPEFVLQALLEGKWKSVKNFYTQAEVDAHVQEMDKLRSNGDGIIPGRIWSNKAKKYVAHIEGNEPEAVGPSLDEIASTPKARGERALSVAIDESPFTE